MGSIGFPVWRRRTAARYNPSRNSNHPEAAAISPRSKKAIARIFLAAMLGTHAFFLWSVRGRIARGDPDFTVFFTAGKILREGKGFQLYDPATQRSVQREFTADTDLRRGALPYLHPPLEALLFLPFTFLSYPNAFVLWSLLNVGMLLTALLLLQGCLGGLRQFSRPDLLLAALAFFPIFANFHQGQDAILLLLVLVVAYRALVRQADFAAGCWLGVAMFKFHLIFPLVLILAFWKGRKLFLGFAAAASAVFLLSVALVGWQEVFQYPVFLWRVISLPGFGRIPFRKLPNLMGLLGGWPYVEDLGWPLQLAVLACSVGLLAVLMQMRDLVKDVRLLNLGVASAVIAALLVGYSTNTYDLSLLVLPLALVAEHALRERRAAGLSLILPAVPLFLSPLWFFLWMRWERINLMALFLLWWIYALRSEMLRMRAEAPKQTKPVLA